MSHQEEAAGSPGKEVLLGKKEPGSGRQMENFRFILRHYQGRLS